LGWIEEPQTPNTQKRKRRKKEEEDLLLTLELVNKQLKLDLVFSPSRYRKLEWPSSKEVCIILYV
jgi:hypothetical protein